MSENTAKITDPIWDSRNGDEPEDFLKKVVEGSSAETAIPKEFPPYAFSSERDGHRPLWDADDMRDYAAHVLKLHKDACDQDGASRAAEQLVNQYGIHSANPDGRAIAVTTFAAIIRQHCGRK